MIDETRVADRTVAEIDETVKVRQLQNSIEGMTQGMYDVSDNCILVLVAAMDREWTPEEYINPIAALKFLAPRDDMETLPQGFQDAIAGLHTALYNVYANCPADIQHVVKLEQLRIVVPSEVPETDDCKVWVSVHPKFTAKEQ